MIDLILKLILLLLTAKKALEAAKSGNYLKFLVEDSDRLAEEDSNNKSSTYATQAQAIASIIQKYYTIAPRFNELVQDKNKNYEDTMKRFLGSHQGVLESFLAKLIEKTKGIEERDKFVKILNNQGFDYAEGFDIDIKNKELGEPTVHISYKKEKDGEIIFEFDEDLPKEIIDRLILPESKRIRLLAFHKEKSFQRKRRATKVMKTQKLIAFLKRHRWNIQGFNGIPLYLHCAASESGWLVNKKFGLSYRHFFYLFLRGEHICITMKMIGKG